MLDFLKKHKVKIIIIIILALFFLTASLFVYKIYSNNKVEKGNNSLFSKIEEITTSSTEKKLDDNQKASVEDQFNKCQNADDYKTDTSFGSGFNDFFYMLTEAIAKNDETICANIGQKFDRDHEKICLTQYYRSRIIRGEQGEASGYLDKLQVLGANTLPEEAYIKKDISICDKINDVVQKHLCRVSISLDKNDCVFNENEDFFNTSACSKNDAKQIQFGCDLDKKNAELLCTNYFYGMMAIKNKDNSYCQKINANGYFNKLECLSILSEKPLEEISKAYKENVCYEKFAIDLALEKNDISICDKIPNKDSDNDKPIFEKCISLSK